MSLLPGEHRIGRNFLIVIFGGLTLFFGAYLFERPAREGVAKAFLKADPTLDAADLEILERDALTFRPVFVSGRGEIPHFSREVDTVLWCARDRKRPDRRMALNFYKSRMPLMSGPRTVARSWVLGRGIVADNMLAECARLAALGPPALP